VLEDTVTASVSDFAVRGASGAGLLVDRGPVDATAARVEVTLRRISIEGARWGVEVLGGASISLRDLHVTDADSWGLRAQSIDGPTLAVHAAGIWALRTGGFAFKRFERSFVAPDPWIIEDAIAIAPHDAADDTIREGVLRVTDAATVEARRLYLGPGKEIGVVMRESTLRLEDITVQGPRVDGLELRALGPTTVTRAVARDVPGVGFTVAQSVNGGALVTLRDVRVRADADSGGPALGIVDESNTGLDLARFLVAGTSLGLGVKAATRAREGALTDCALGVRLAEGVAPGAALSGVHIGCTRALEGP